MKSSWLNLFRLFTIITLAPLLRSEVTTTDPAPAQAKPLDEKPAPIRGLFFEATSPEGATVWLMGSVHVGRQDMYPLPAAVDRAVERSRAIAFELPMDPASQLRISMLMIKEGMNERGVTLRESVNEKTRKSLDAYLERTQLPARELDKFKPWMAALTVTMLEFAQWGFDTDNGIDAHLFERARASGKTLLALESPESQIKIFNDMPPAMAETFLRQSLEDLQGFITDLEKMIEAWKRGDSDTLDELITKDLKQPQYLGLYEALFLDRNIRMTENIIHWSDNYPSLLIVVGAGHLVGRGSVIDLLKQNGWHIHQPE